VSARLRVIVTRTLPAATEAALRAAYDVTLNPDDHAFTPAEWAAAWAEAEAVVCTVADRLPAAVLPDGPRRTRLLANFGVGLDHIDRAAAARAGLTVTNTPGVLTEDTADLALALMLAVLRRMGEGERELRAGHWAGWRPTHLLGTRLSGRTLGIVGYGRIGAAVAARAHHGFGMPIRWYAPRGPGAGIAPLGERVGSLAELVATCDVLSLHCPATPESRGMIDAGVLEAARPGLVLINTARGDVVDEPALVQALRSGRLGGAGLDVYAREPEVPAELLSLPNVVLLPHLGSATRESREAMGARVLANLAAFAAGRPLPDRVG
jgi:lactate dehydrogenase-like 2-hydroxyacid dehydrogenase